MWCGIVTLFPEMFRALTDFGITRRAIEQGLLSVQCWNPRDFTSDRHQTVDDRPYGGGPGMVMMSGPLRAAIQAARKAAPGPVKVVYLSPQGKQLQQAKLCEIAKMSSNVIFIAGRYEGIDERVLALEVDEEWSIGDYVLSGGELPIMVVIDAVTRWLPEALGHPESAAADSFVDGLLDCPHYTRPVMVEGLEVPAVLLSGDHAAIAKWRLKQKLGSTWLKRPDLLAGVTLDKVSNALLTEYIEELRSIKDE